MQISRKVQGAHPSKREKNSNSVPGSPVFVLMDTSNPCKEHLTTRSRPDVLPRAKGLQDLMLAENTVAEAIQVLSLAGVVAEFLTKTGMRREGAAHGLVGGETEGSVQERKH